MAAFEKQRCEVLPKIELNGTITLTPWTVFYVLKFVYVY